MALPLGFSDSPPCCHGFWRRFAEDIRGIGLRGIIEGAKKTPALVAGVGPRYENLGVVTLSYTSWRVIVNE